MKWRAPLLFVVSLCGFAEAGVRPEFLIQNYHVGLVSADMTPTQASQAYPSARVKWWEPYASVHVIDIDASAEQGVPPPLRIYLDRAQQRIMSIAISDKRYQTAQGIGIDSTFGALRKAHPRLTIRTEEGEMDRYIVAEITGEGIACQLQYDEETWRKMLAQPNRQNVSAATIPDDKPIQFISVYRPPPATGTNSWGE